MAGEHCLPSVAGRGVEIRSLPPAINYQSRASLMESSIRARKR